MNLEPLKGLSIDAVAGIDILLNEGMTLVPSTSISERNSGVDEARAWKALKEKNGNECFIECPSLIIRYLRRNMILLLAEIWIII